MSECRVFGRFECLPSRAVITSPAALTRGNSDQSFELGHAVVSRLGEVRRRILRLWGRLQGVCLRWLALSLFVGMIPRIGAVDFTLIYTHTSWLICLGGAGRVDNDRIVFRSQRGGRSRDTVAAAGVFGRWPIHDLAWRYRTAVPCIALVPAWSHGLLWHGEVLLLDVLRRVRRHILVALWRWLGGLPLSLNRCVRRSDVQPRQTLVQE